MFKTSLLTSEPSRARRFGIDNVCLDHFALVHVRALIIVGVIVSVWAAVDQGLSDRIAKAVGASPVKPLKVKPASEAVKFRANLGFASKQI